MFWAIFIWNIWNKCMTAIWQRRSVYVDGSIHHAVQSLDEAPARYTHTANVDFAASEQRNIIKSKKWKNKHSHAKINALQKYRANHFDSKLAWIKSRQNIHRIYLGFPSPLPCQPAAAGCLFTANQTPDWPRATHAPPNALASWKIPMMAPSLGESPEIPHIAMARRKAWPVIGPNTIWIKGHQHQHEQHLEKKEQQTKKNIQKKIPEQNQNISIFCQEIQAAEWNPHSPASSANPHLPAAPSDAAAAARAGPAGSTPEKIGKDLLLILLQLWLVKFSSY